MWRERNWEGFLRNVQQSKLPFNRFPHIRPSFSFSSSAFSQSQSWQLKIDWVTWMFCCSIFGAAYRKVFPRGNVSDVSTFPEQFILLICQNKKFDISQCLILCFHWNWIGLCMCWLWLCRRRWQFTFQEFLIKEENFPHEIIQSKALDQRFFL